MYMMIPRAIKTGFFIAGTQDVWRLLRGASTDRFNSRATISRQTWQGSPTELLRGGSHL